ncbi:MAG TPA: hypothetical protein VGU61_11815 [Noviherbaspirillum sp.]|uniref:protein kinase domain-containing protein n=1 Tax=Noviherbaspirillum sp. TaxID=1926288 RepID=UPI002DDCA0C0|nr:hypothetical protein [Noviherbaspirillum sp.]HEV2610945.1 hypothetical protein [Noviherbaspirillum sp.]
MKIPGKISFPSHFFLTPKHRRTADAAKTDSGHAGKRATENPGDRYAPGAAKRSFLQQMFSSKKSGGGRGDKGGQAAIPIEENGPLHLTVPLDGLNLQLFADKFDIFDLDDAPRVLSDRQAMKIEELSADLEPLGVQHVNDVPVTKRLVLEAKLIALRHKVAHYRAAMEAEARNHEITEAGLQERMVQNLGSIDAKLEAMLEGIGAEMVEHLEKQVVDNMRAETVVPRSWLKKYVEAAKTELDKAYTGAGGQSIPDGHRRLEDRVREKIECAAWSKMAPRNLAWDGDGPFLIRPDLVIGAPSIMNESRGHGSYGGVYLMRCEDGTELICKKAFGDPGKAWKHAIEVLEREAGMYKKVADIAGPHPNIVNVYGLVRQTVGNNNEPMLIMDKITGHNGLKAFVVLKQDWDSGRISSKQYWGSMQFIARRLFDASQHLLKAGIVHNDIKPTNFMIDTSTGEPILFDLGLASPVDKYQTGCTPRYRPEARFKREIPASEKTDAWSTIATVADGVDIMDVTSRYNRLLARKPLKGPKTSYTEFQNKLFAKIDASFVYSAMAKDLPFIHDSMIDDSEAREVLKNVFASDAEYPVIPNRPIAKSTQTKSLEALIEESATWNWTVRVAAEEIQTRLRYKASDVVSGVNPNGLRLDRTPSDGEVLNEHELSQKQKWADDANQRIALAVRTRATLEPQIDIEALRRFVSEAQRVLNPVQVSQPGSTAGAGSSTAIAQLQPRRWEALSRRTNNARTVLDLLDATADMHPNGARVRQFAQFNKEQRGMVHMLEKHMTKRYAPTNSIGARLLYASKLRSVAKKGSVPAAPGAQPVSHEGKGTREKLAALTPGRTPKMPRFLKKSMEKHAAEETEGQSAEQQREKENPQPKPYRKV